MAKQKSYPNQTSVTLAFPCFTALIPSVCGSKDAHRGRGVFEIFCYKIAIKHEKFQFQVPLQKNSAKPPTVVHLCAEDAIFEGVYLVLWSFSMADLFTNVKVLIVSDEF
jgi:hypothetical protein